jgi:O-antigen chain-terminating methyltransferase
MTDLFYRAFEDKHRGSRELIKSRLKVYLPFVQPFLTVFPKGKALDLGCGRGEWIELLSEEGFDTLGVDLDDAMLQACKDLNLNVKMADAIDYMQSLHQDSLCVVTGFHIAEHLPFEVLQRLVQEALRVLVPGGLLILETPNPENIIVGSNSFYMDPTHQRPLPPELLKFLPEHYGFERAKVLRLQENPSLKDIKNPELIDVLKGVSPDFAVISQKSGSLVLLESLNDIFKADYGISLEHIAEKFQADFTSKIDIKDQLSQSLVALQTTQQLSVQLIERATQSEVALQSAQQLSVQLIERATQAESRELEYKIKFDEFSLLNGELRSELYAVNQANHHHWQLAESRQLQLDALYSSTSWILTSPLRWPIKQYKWFKKTDIKLKAKSGISNALRSLLIRSVAYPKLKRVFVFVAFKLGITNFLKTLIQSSQTTIDANTIASFQHSKKYYGESGQALSPRARRIYHDLNLAIEKKEKDKV